MVACRLQVLASPVGTVHKSRRKSADTDTECRVQYSMPIQECQLVPTWAPPQAPLQVGGAPYRPGHRCSVKVASSLTIPQPWLLGLFRSHSELGLFICPERRASLRLGLLRPWPVVGLVVGLLSEPVSPPPPPLPPSRPGRPSRPFGEGFHAPLSLPPRTRHGAAHACHAPRACGFLILGFSAGFRVVRSCVRHGCGRTHVDPYVALL